MEFREGDNVIIDYPGSNNGESKAIKGPGIVTKVGKSFIIVEMNNEQKVFHPCWATKSN
jgi:hypothetical protein